MDIFITLASIEHNRHHLLRYYRFIRYCQQKNTTLIKRTKRIPTGIYMESHHICPKALFPNFSSFRANPYNKIDLTARQHFIAHHMLWKAYGKKMAYAFNLMINTSVGKVTSITYSKLKEAMKPTEKTRQKISNKMKGKRRPDLSGSLIKRYGENRAIEIRQNMSGRKATVETKNKMRNRIQNCIWINNAEEERFIPKEELESFLKVGYVKGRKPNVLNFSTRDFYGEKNPAYGMKRNDLAERNRTPKRWMTNSTVDKLVPVNQVELLQQNGFVFGRLSYIQSRNI